MRKKYIGYSISILLVCLIAGGFVWLQIGRNRNRAEEVQTGVSTGAGISQKDYPDKIPVANWNGLDKMYRICNTKLKGNYHNYISECYTAFSSDVSLENMIQTNRDDYIGMFTYYIGGLKKSEGALFFKDDNYYFLSYNEYWDIFKAECCYSEYAYDHYSTYLPTPVQLILKPDRFDTEEERGYHELDILYNNYSFDAFCRFYERMSPNLYKIDKEKQRVTVSGYDLAKDKMRYRFITFDFKNQSVIGPGEKGKTITISKHKQPSPKK